MLFFRFLVLLRRNLIGMKIVMLLQVSCYQIRRIFDNVYIRLLFLIFCNRYKP